jgi:hypothetical protein
VEKRFRIPRVVKLAQFVRLLSTFNSRRLGRHRRGTLKLDVMNYTRRRDAAGDYFELELRWREDPRDVRFQNTITGEVRRFPLYEIQDHHALLRRLRRLEKRYERGDRAPRPDGE